jgi:type IV secretory pathway VirB3-like protein
MYFRTASTTLPPEDAPSRAPRQVGVHRSLTRKPYVLGVGYLVLGVDLALVWIAYVATGLFSPVFMGTTLAVLALTGGVRWARSRDQYAVEVFLRAATTPALWATHARPGVAPRRPPPSIPTNP